MRAKEFEAFRLVGGTSLSLQIGHRESVDIDLFSDLTYGSIDFNVIDSYLDKEFPYVDDIRELFPGMGKSYLIGKDKENAIKLDVYHTDDFIRPLKIEDGIRMATIEEIIAHEIGCSATGRTEKGLLGPARTAFRTWSREDAGIARKAIPI